MSKTNVLKEALADVEALKRAAESSAERVLKEHFNDKIKALVEAQLNEEYDDSDEGDYEEEDADLEENLVGGQDEHDMDYPYNEGVEDMEDEEDLDLGLEDDDEDMDMDMDDGFSEDDLAEALSSVLSEVEHGQLGDMEWVDQDKHADSRGLNDEDGKEAGWEEKTPPKSTQTQVYGGGSYNETKKLAVANAKLKKENRQLSKAVKVLKGAVNEMKLFNVKLLNTHKLLKVEGLTKEAQTKIVESMDAAKSAAEVKRVFENWKSAISVMGERKSSSLKEAIGSGVRQSQGVSNGGKPLVENAEVQRMKRLAGIIKD